MMAYTSKIQRNLLNYNRLGGGKNVIAHFPNIKTEPSAGVR